MTMDVVEFRLRSWYWLNCRRPRPIFMCERCGIREVTRYMFRDGDSKLVCDEFPRCEPMGHCCFHDAFDPDTGDPCGEQCSSPAVSAIVWKDGRVSPACERHGLTSLDQDARSLVRGVALWPRAGEWPE